jgi:hypothetical protein
VFVHDERARAAARVERSWAELLLHAAPVEMRAPLFRALLKVIHPDVGGSAELTRALIAAYEKARLP